ncbi:hypothetical protein K9L63_02370 [Candidatus Gracilibacteria bacterium]|nr:hypothetical protein [Candidatus Gracilibacteria bacterium]
MIEFWITNAREIMFLCFGGGFLLFVLFAIRTMWIATRLLRKLDDLTDLFIEYIQKPLKFIIEAQKILSKVLGWWKK